MDPVTILSLLVGVCSLAFTVGKTIWDERKQRSSDAKKSEPNFKNLNLELYGLLHLATEMERKADELGETSDQEYKFWRNTRIAEISNEAATLVSQYKLERKNLSKKKLAELSKKMEDCADRVRRLREDADAFLSRFEKKYRNKKISSKKKQPRKEK
ncbi:uncharacterized protein LOC110619842 [Manihot esculenta]|uniref:Rx N-terminal domain-containing protein n=1 Tax=Manihot esculenta TaxID=3983 RepID=A0A2C9VHW8_MANES|nr:uncharacterized protein LOC110619842 [Manihot esculenta]OAY45061.1 hypothetical protein MANES_07G027600v8 [Manihot esculenta]